ncbi:MAG: PAS domain S-box protein [Anaerolineae bacterium]|nr:PAS domain S-box protein [Anaerolineae bacterium]
MRQLLSRFDTRVTLVYAAIALLWVILTDALLMALSQHDPTLIGLAAMLKGVGFVLVSTLALSIVLSAEWRKRVRVEQALQDDIAMRKRLQAAQEQNVRTMDEMRQFLQATLDAFPANTVALDASGTIISFNAAWKHFSIANGGPSESPYLGANYLAVCDAAAARGEQEAAAAAAGIRAVIAGQHDYFFLEYPCHSPDEQRWCAMRVMPLVGPAPRRVVVAHQDVTERWQAQEALQRAYETLEQRIVERTAELRAAKERVEAVLHHSADGILLVSMGLAIQQSNRSFCTLFGCEPDSYTGAAFDALAHPDDAALVREAAGQVVATGAHKAVELRARRRDGSLFDAELSIGYVNGEGLVCTVRDITERKHAEEALRQALAKEQELGELKSRFVAMASHEFRTPLATIQATADTLIAYRDRMGDDQITEKLSIICQQVGLLRDVMRDLLHLARLETHQVEFEPVETDPDALCRDVIEEFRSHPGATHRVAYVCGPVPSRVPLDRRLMRQIISNLVSNAIKFSEAGKTVNVRLEQDGNALALIVQDEGLGIPDVDLKYLFKPFYRATNVGAISGIGLGLVATKESVDLHGGAIAVESKVGVGTTFTVRIPIVRPRSLHGDVALGA